MPALCVARPLFGKNVVLGLLSSGTVIGISQVLSGGVPNQGDLHSMAQVAKLLNGQKDSSANFIFSLSANELEMRRLLSPVITQRGIDSDQEQQFAEILRKVAEKPTEPLSEMERVLLKELQDFAGEIGRAMIALNPPPMM